MMIPLGTSIMLSRNLMSVTLIWCWSISSSHALVMEILSAWSDVSFATARTRFSVLVMVFSLLDSVELCEFLASDDNNVGDGVGEDGSDGDDSTS